MAQTNSVLRILFLSAVCTIAFLLGRYSKTSSQSIEFPASSAEEVKTVESGTLETITTPSIESLQSITQYGEEVERAYFFAQFLDRMSSEEVPAVFAELEALRPSKMKTDLLSQFFARWGELSGEEAFEAAMNIPGEDGRQFQGYAAEGWALVDPREAWNALMVLSNSGSVYIPRTSSTIGRIAQGDAGLAMELISTIQDGVRQQNYFNAMVSSVAEIDRLPNLLNHLPAVENTSQKHAYTELLFTEWGKLESMLSMDVIDTLEDPSMVQSAVKGMMMGWAAKDGWAAFEFAAQHADDPLFAGISGSIAEEWTRNATADDVGEILTAIESAGGREEILNNVFYSLARANPFAALEWVETNPDQTKRAQMKQFLLSNIATVDFEAAKTMFRNLPNDRERLELSYSMVNNSIRNGDSPEATLEILDAYETDEMRGRAMTNIIYVASQKENFENSAELRAVLINRVMNDQDLPEQARENLLQRLTKK